MPEKQREGELVQSGFEVEEKVLTDKEEKYREELIQRLCQMRDDRDSSHEELDGMTYVQYYESNRKKDLSYIPPKKNKQDVRIVTGTTREKGTTLLSTLLNMDLAPDVAAFDKDDFFLVELGDNLADLVKKSREIEDWDKYRPLIYREMIAQGDVFIEERWIEEYQKIPLGNLDWNPRGKEKISSFDFKEALQKVDCYAKAKMIDGRKVYLGNMNIEYAQDQDIVATVEVVTRAKAHGMFGEWERWKNVPTTVDETALVENSNTYQDWNLISNNQNQVVIIRVYNYRDNRFMILLNGMMMLPINYPLTAISPSGKPLLVQGKLEPISGFAYSKSLPSKTKVDQEVLDEFTKLAVEKNRQSFKPPMGNTTKKVYSSNIFLAGKVTNDIRKDQLFPLIDSGGLSNADFNFYKMIQENINDKTTNDVFGGQDPSGDPTATEINQLQQQQMLKLGASLDGIVNLERSMTWIRIQTILHKWTEVQDKRSEGVKDGVYKTVSVKTTLPEGTGGTKIFRFTNQQFPDVADQEQEEENMGKQYNSPVRIVYMNPREIRRLKAYFYIMINPTQKTNDKMAQILFVQQVQQAQELFGVESLNYDYLKQRYAMVMDEDYSKMFVSQDVQQQQQMLQQQEAGGKIKQSNQARVSPADADGKKPLRAIVR